MSAPRVGEYIAVNLDEINGEPVGTFGWGVNRHGCGQQRHFAPLSEEEARVIAARLNVQAVKWTPAVNGTGARNWFLSRDALEFKDRYHRDKNGNLVRYASEEGAQRAADRLNTAEANRVACPHCQGPLGAPEYPAEGGDAWRRCESCGADVYGTD